MPSIPLPFVVVLLLVVLFASLSQRKNKSYLPALIFIACSAVTISLVGLRWTTDWEWVRNIQPIVASLVPPLTWWCFTHALSGKGKWQLLQTPVVACAALLISYSPALYGFVDVFIVLVYLGYAVALFRLNKRSSDVWEGVKFSQMPAFKSLLYFAAGLLAFSALVDIAIVVDFALSEGKNVVAILSVGHSLILPVLAYVVTVASGSVAEPSEALPVVTQEKPTRSEEQDENEHQAVLDVVQELLSEHNLHADPNLNLNKLARKAGIPSRKISSAVNALKQRNVSQFINEYRIQDAMRLLETTNHTVTEIYEMVGFHSKSNFNREFSRVTETTPSRYRKQA
ncbi:putative AraC-type DNA-binding domain-containing protein [Vibrio nigripulchritudo SO65]|uniref:helix-turn-helix domain-containing protein n=1 Tax=Vibrio nigripulchritudo TaxID=28173 RepID=UPI0003B201C0|nr:AraC family transcriptional regulator [Vibrio nigripulchritudo]CCN33962.1 putative AraC-type DNA-binding domain-containing protein [Vibrio nigripulchritudo AM115]CCN42249.1 putative AraC-type DNA-binding domain-containing protein [Vibrio nigripulchritudo FTn2]CCN65874.1 putative AraC-type DNA-binding domain-containing protein [Vibrio nigripulchritudo POn4]CCN68490.1 putative AraC-type DNA-binding domain-containing protein [Vibrio nigripulchritudo SFn118]CCN75882.1 putative AraC-type DNA-bin